METVWPKSFRRMMGLVFNSIGLVCVVIGTVLNSYQYKLANADFRVDSPFASVGQLQLACTVFSYFAVTCTYVGIFIASKRFLWVLLVIGFISMTWNISIATLSIVAGSTGWVKTAEICVTPYKGLLGEFHDVDTYFQIVDQVLCSRGCPCYMSEETRQSYQRNVTFSAPFYTYTTTNNPGGAKTFSECASEMKYFAYEEAVRRNPNFDPKGTIDLTRLYQYFANVEKQFQCTGWCRLNYYNPDYQSLTFINKYLFSDVNGRREDEDNMDIPPRYYGCFDELMEWLPPYLMSWAAVVFVGVGCQIVLLSLGIHKLVELKKYGDYSEANKGYERKPSPETAEDQNLRI